MPGLKKIIKKPTPKASQEKKKDTSLNNNLKLLLGIFVLKTKTNKENPMGCSELVENIGKFTHYDVGDANGRRLGEGLELISTLQESGADSLTLTLGGKIVLSDSSSGNKSARSDSKQFYFEPLLSESHTDLINSLIISERHLSNPLKDFLHERVTGLNPFPYQAFDELEAKVASDFEEVKDNGKKTLQNDIRLYKKDLALKIFHETGEPKLSKNQTNHQIIEPHAVDFINQVQIIQTLYFAIKNELKVKISYGKFQFNESRMGRPKFSINEENGEAKQYVLSPYALAWSGGHYYLICKKDNKPNLSAYRVDRINTADYCEVPLEELKEKELNKNLKNKTSIKDKKNKVPVKDESNEFQGEYEKREPLPEQYANFHIKEKDGFSFDVDSFLKTYPLMITGGSKSETFSEESGKRNGISVKSSSLVDVAHIQCGETGYSILVDYFGDSISGKRNTSASDEESHYPYLISLKNIGEEALVRLCLNYHSIMILKKPLPLVKQVREELKKSLSQYDNLLDGEV